MFRCAEREKIVNGHRERGLSLDTTDHDPERAVQTAVRLVGVDPLQEAVHPTLMRAPDYARSNCADYSERAATQAAAWGGLPWS